jgi:hypothetical protein
LIVMLCVAIVIVPARPLAPVLAEKLAVKEAAVVPLPCDTFIQLASLTDAAHDPPLQPLGPALTVNIVEPPTAGIVATDEGLAENVQVGGAAPAWGTVMLWPAIVIVPVRPRAPVLAR